MPVIDEGGFVIAIFGPGRVYQREWTGCWVMWSKFLAPRLSGNTIPADGFQSGRPYSGEQFRATLSFGLKPLLRRDIMKRVMKKVRIEFQGEVPGLISIRSN